MKKLLPLLLLLLLATATHLQAQRFVQVEHYWRSIRIHYPDRTVDINVEYALPLANDDQADWGKSAQRLNQVLADLAQEDYEVISTASLTSEGFYIGMHYTLRKDEE